MSARWFDRPTANIVLMLAWAVAVVATCAMAYWLAARAYLVAG